MKLDFVVLAITTYYTLALLVGGHFAVAAVQGDHGRFARISILDEEEALKVELADLEANVKRMENKVRRLSDNYLDLELLDERARVMLGFASDHEIILN